MSDIPKILESLIKLAIPPVAVEVTRFRYSLIENRPGDSVIVVCAHLSNYFADLRLTNRANSIIYIKDIFVTVNDCRTFKYDEPKDKIRLEPHECVDCTVSFPVPEDTTPDKNGTYRLEVLPTIGRKSSITGDFFS